MGAQRRIQKQEQLADLMQLLEPLRESGLAAQRTEVTFVKLLEQLETGNEMLAALVKANGLELPEKPKRLSSQRRSQARKSDVHGGSHGSVLITNVSTPPIEGGVRQSGVFSIKRSLTAGHPANPALMDNMPGAPDDGAGGPRRSLHEVRQTFERQGTSRQSHKAYAKRATGEMGHSSQAYEDVLPANAL